MKSISDVVSASGLSGYAEIALLLFFAVFVVVGVRAIITDRATLDRAARLPLDEDYPSSTSGSLSPNSRCD